MDAGAGFDPSRHSGGIGMLSMRDRIGAVGGELVVASEPGRGTTVPRGRSRGRLRRTARPRDSHGDRRPGARKTGTRRRLPHQREVSRPRARGGTDRGATPVDAVVFSGWSPTAARPKRSRCVRPGGARGRARGRADGPGDRGERGPHGSAARRARDQRAIVVCAPLHRYRTRFFFSRLYGAHGIETEVRVAHAAPSVGRCSGKSGPLRLWTPAEGRASRAESGEEAMSDTVVFIPAWNEEQNLPAVFDDLRTPARRGRPRRRRRLHRPHGRGCAGARRGGAVPGREQGAARRDRGRLSLGARARIRVLRSRRRRRPAPRGRALAAARPSSGRPLRRRGRIALRIGRRIRALPVQARPRATVRDRRAPSRDGCRARPSFRRRDERPLRVNAKALPLLAEPFSTAAPEVEALIRITDAGLTLEEVPVNMAARASGESKLRGSKALQGGADRHRHARRGAAAPEEALALNASSPSDDVPGARFTRPWLEFLE